MAPVGGIRPYYEAMQSDALSRRNSYIETSSGLIAKRNSVTGPPNAVKHYQNALMSQIQTTAPLIQAAEQDYQNATRQLQNLQAMPLSRGSKGQKPFQNQGLKPPNSHLSRNTNAGFSGGPGQTLSFLA